MLKNNKETINSELTIPNNINNQKLQILTTRLLKYKVNLNTDNEKDNIINNPNFLVLIKEYIININIEELIDEDKNFFYSFLINIHARLYTVLKLWYLDLDIDKKNILSFLKIIENILYNFGDKFKIKLQWLDDIIQDIHESYEKYINTNNKDNELLGSIIIDSLTKIDEIEFWLLNEKNISFINNIWLSFKLKVESILIKNYSPSLNIIMEEKLKNIEKILKLTNKTPVRKLDTNDNWIIIIDTLNFLLEQFNILLKTESNSVILNNDFTEAFLSTLEKIPQYHILNNIEENILYILINIIDSREYASINPNIDIFKNNTDYKDPTLNKSFLKRWNILYNWILMK